ncbi:MAG TPA: fumarylacetoacetate hydrolase family protein [Solirubrobacterales bacterium]|nr:fumarylacetoacetate hydrolase family protein [Solirubrobacterales bacterium]
MRVVSYRSDRGVRAGVLRDNRVVDAWDAIEPGGSMSSVRELLAAGALDELAAGDGDGIALAGVSLDVPVPDPQKIICIGLNYRAHAAEAGIDPPSAPTFFAKFRNALTSDGAEVTLPAASEKVDYEAEVAFVVGKRAHEVAEADALDHVAGYTLLNDLSARDLQFATPQWMPGKVFDGSAPCGPALVTPDEAGAHDAIGISLTLNGETMQSADTSDLIFSVPELVSHLSRWMTLEPGDIVSTGTPSGVGSVREPRVWLKDGDEVVVSSPSLGRLRTKIRR